MIEIIILILFCISLFVCVFLDLSLFYALFSGLILFIAYGLYKGNQFLDLLNMAIKGMANVRNILITFILIGIMTSFWRASGSIPYMIALASKLINPSIFLLMTFLLNCIISLLTGSAFSTAATIGVICASMGLSMGMNPAFIGGAVLSGAFFGDRMSPVSTSALFISELSRSDLYVNIRNMFKTAMVPFICSCIVYGLIGICNVKEGMMIDFTDIFLSEFHLHYLTLLPILTIIIFSLFKIKTKISLAVSIVFSFLIAISIQNYSFSELLQMSVFGYVAHDKEVGLLLNGGGIISMLKVSGIVCFSSSYTYLFQNTGLLDGIKEPLKKMTKHFSSYIILLLISILANMISCNQTLGIILSKQLCEQLYDDPCQLALDLEDSAAVSAPLIPWSIACNVPLSMVNAPSQAVLYAFFLIFLIIYRLITSLKHKQNITKLHSELKQL